MEEEDARFKYFPPDADNDLGGVRSYLAPQLTAVCILVKDLVSTNTEGWDLQFLYNIGDRIADGAALINMFDLPSIGTRDWLVTRMTQERLGGALRLSITLRMSGPDGWNDLIYAVAT